MKYFVIIIWNLLRLCLFLMALFANTLSAKRFLMSGHVLDYGSYLISENGQFKMGFDKNGVLTIEDIGAEPMSKTQRIYWTPTVKSITSSHDGNNCQKDGYRTPFSLERLFWPTTPWGAFGSEAIFCECRKLPRVPVGPSGCGKCSNKKGTDWGRRLSIRGYQLYITNYEGAAVWNTEPMPFNWSKNAGGELLAQLIEYKNISDYKPFLYLTNCGRAILATRKGMLWCSCDYCVTTVPLKKDYWANSDLNTSIFIGMKRRNGNMPTHAELEEEFRKNRPPNAPAASDMAVSADSQPVPAGSYLEWLYEQALASNPEEKEVKK